jgi:GGDEF domain-containing protein
LVSGDHRRLRAVPGLEDEPEEAAEVIALAARAAGRRAVIPRPRPFGPSVLNPSMPRPRVAVPTGPVAQRVLRQRLAERLDEALTEPCETTTAFSVAVVEVDPTPSRHPVGRERLLTALATRLADATRPADLVVRPTPNRFVLVLSGARDNYGLAAARRRICDVLSRPVLIDGRPVRTTVAVGVVPAAADDTVEGLLNRLVDSARRDRRSLRRLRSVESVDRWF